MPTTDPTAAGMLAAICAAPRDDFPRLAMADWLEEYGEGERAEFIRVQIQLHNAPLEEGNRNMGFREWERLKARERELLLANGMEWLPCVGIKPMMHDGGESEGVNFEIVTGTWQGSGIQVDYRRGFLAVLTLTAADWLRYADALAWHPEHSKCLKCYGTKRNDIGHPKGPIHCAFCDGRGIRPMPATAVPLEEVHITGDLHSIGVHVGSPILDTAYSRRCWLAAGDRQTGPCLVNHLERPDVARQRIVMTCLAVEWPWIRFVSPTETP